MRLAVYPGHGVVARLETAAMLVLGGDASLTTAELLVDACSSPEGLRDRLRDLGPKTPPGSAFLVVAQGSDTIELFVHGAMKVAVVLEDSRMELASTDAGGWVEESLHGQPDSIAAGPDAVWTGSPELLDLQLGVVPGGGFEMVGRATAAGVPAIPAAGEVVKDPAAGTVLAHRSAIGEAEAAATLAPEFSHLPTLGAVTASTAGPEARSVCSNGHVNDPDAITCSICGAALGVETNAGSPPLGRLSAKDGRSVIVERSLLIGRKPEDAPEVASGELVPFAVPLSERGVSRVHAEIRVDRWNVLLVDRNSANGTFVKPPGVDEWIRLEPGHAVQIVHGTAVAVGPYELTFEPV